MGPSKQVLNKWRKSFEKVRHNTIAADKPQRKSYSFSVFAKKENTQDPAMTTEALKEKCELLQSICDQRTGLITSILKMLFFTKNYNKGYLFQLINGNIVSYRLIYAKNVNDARQLLNDNGHTQSVEWIRMVTMIL
jgi:hypothetical protein